ncbi:MAG: DUF3800 domain-containing protein [Alphaproteobacteria bacterium]|nr:DUF3800 domain-containing protein [Alphaproteobacteria bacterium]
MSKSIRRLGFSDYIVYVDESGTPQPITKNDVYPVFVLTFVIVRKYTYANYIVPAVQNLKYEFWGHDSINLHSYDIRQKENQFAFLNNQEENQEFMESLSTIMDESNYVIVSSIIDKNKFKDGKRDMYHMAMQFCIERLHSFLLTKNEHGKTTHIVFEGRGKKEDKILKQEFDKVLNNIYDSWQSHAQSYEQTPMEMVIAKKTTNSTGLQIADLLGYPIGRQFLAPNKENRPYEIIERKFYRKGKRNIGKKIFPTS